MNRVGPNYGVGPAAFKRLMKRLKNPQDHVAIIHVDGTNGKGSVCYATAQVLQAAGYRTGLFISPHLFSPTERIQLNGQPISPKTFMVLCQEVLQAEEEKLNFFELLTAAAFLYFFRQKADYVVLETGLGGKKDPTNVCKPVACVITSIGLDHCAVLGSTLRQIAREKAGIIKRKIPIFCPVLPTEAQREIKSAVQRKQAPLHIVRAGQPFRLEKIAWHHGYMCLQTKQQRWKVGLLGKKQVQNACLVYQVCRFLNIAEECIKKGLAHVKVPCRFEVRQLGKKYVILDGAHNLQAMENLLAFWEKSPFTNASAVVCGFMRDKDYPQMLKQLSQQFQTIYLTRPTHARAVPPAQLKQWCGPQCCVYVFASAKQAVHTALSRHSNILVTGSFYLVAAVEHTLQTVRSHARDARKD